MSDNGISFFSLLGLLFVGLKLGGIIDWSWWYVLAPFWAPLAVAGIALCAALAVGVARTHRRSGRR